MATIPKLLTGFMFICQFVWQTSGHGRMMNPPARNCMWRFGFPVPVNYNDNELFCGGYTQQQVVNNGSCGLCGDNWIDPVPRAHETGGKFGVAQVTRTFYSGQQITVTVELTSNHYGYFTFRICSIIFYQRECAGQHLLDRNTLYVVHPNGTQTPTYVLESKEKKVTVDLTVQLPYAFNCSRCCLQWTYTTGNSWGTCPDGNQAVGCGPQENFRNCADVTIRPMKYTYNNMKLKSSHSLAVDPRLTSTSRSNPYMKYYRDMAKSGAPMTALSVRFQRCVSVDNTQHPPGMDDNCQKRCLQYPPDCPASMCKCVKDVIARDWFLKKNPMAHQWCLDQCDVYPVRNCDLNRCVVVYTTQQTYGNNQK